MNFWMKVKNWRNYLIGWLGGKTPAERNVLVKHIAEIEKENRLLKNEIRELKELLNVDCPVVQAEISYPIGMSFDDVKRIAKESIVRQLGEGAYEYAKHFFVEDGRYIACVEVCSDESTK